MARKPRKSKGTWTPENHEILGGKGFIYRVNASGDVWQFRMWISSEKKYVEKSLRTKKKTDAVDLAEELYIQQCGERYFSAVYNGDFTTYIDT